MNTRFVDFFNFLRRKEIATNKYTKEKETFDGTRSRTQKRNAGRKAQSGGYYLGKGDKDQGF